MKLSAALYPRRIASLLPNLKGILFYGSDQNLGHFFSKELKRYLGPSQQNPEEIEIDITQDKNWKHVLVPQMSLDFGASSFKIIRLINAGNGVTKDLDAYLKNPMKNALLVVEGLNLTKAASLLKLFEEADSTVAVACYSDDDEVRKALILEAFEASGLKFSSALIPIALQHLATESGALKQQLEQVILSSWGTEITSKAIEDAAQDPDSVLTDALCYATANGDLVMVLETLRLAYAASMEPIALLRITAIHFNKLISVASEMAQGKSLELALNTLRPPLFFKRKDAFKRQLSMWSLKSLRVALDELLQTELACKSSTPFPELLCERVHLKLASLARR